MIYFDRRLPGPLLDLLKRDGPASWLVPLVRSGLDADVRPHIQFRRNQGKRSYGSIQVYFGRTSPLEILGISKNRIAFRGDKGYIALSRELFEMNVSPDELLTLRPRIEAHLQASCQRVLRTSLAFVRGEAICHAGMLRRYGQDFVAGDQFVAVDSEVRAGFDSASQQHKFEEQERSALGFRSGDFPRKLDAAVVLASGDLGVVELKAKGEGLRRAALQAAVHVGVFSELRSQRGSPYLVNVINSMLEQKASVGLLGHGRFPSLSDGFKIVPIVAVPEQREDWTDLWRKELASVLQTTGSRLAGLRLWQLAQDGILIQDVAARS